MRVPVVGLLGRPGQRKELIISVPPEMFGEEPWGPAVETMQGEIELDLSLEAISGGILVRGPIRATATGACARCLAATINRWEVEVLELHRAVSDVDAGDDDGGDEDDLDYRLVDGDRHLELDQMVRDALVVGQPVRVLCRPDCLGLCPTCGADRNTEPCAHGEERPADARWDALRGLSLPSKDAPDTDDDSA